MIVFELYISINNNGFNGVNENIVDPDLMALSEAS